MHSVHVWQHTTAVHSRQRGRDYVMFKRGVFKHDGVDVQLFKGPYGNLYTTLQHEC